MIMPGGFKDTDIKQMCYVCGDAQQIDVSPASLNWVACWKSREFFSGEAK